MLQVPVAIACLHLSECLRLCSSKVNHSGVRELLEFELKRANIRKPSPRLPTDLIHRVRSTLELVFCTASQLRHKVRELLDFLQAPTLQPAFPTPALPPRDLQAASQKPTTWKTTPAHVSPQEPATTPQETHEPLRTLSHGWAVGPLLQLPEEAASSCCTSSKNSFSM